jgi:hypothetical protein
MALEPDVFTRMTETSNYMKAHLEAIRRGERQSVVHPTHWDLFFLTDCQLAVKVIWQALQNIGLIILPAKEPPLISVHSGDRVGYRAVR